MSAEPNNEQASELESRIRIYDSLVPADHVQGIHQFLTQPRYTFGERSNPGDPFTHWVTDLTTDDTPVRWLAGQILQCLPYETRVQRAYVNAHSFGDCPGIHVDGDSPAQETVLYYANPRWDANWSGETVFFNQQRDEIVRSIYPRPGRIVVFDGRIPHVARPPSRICNEIRLTVAFKLHRQPAPVL
ncbi:MAG: 2OG-Fe(II) oxygenase [Gammaproteobacteria bacterium]|jgi:hypothetical protein